MEHNLRNRIIYIFSIVFGVLALLGCVFFGYLFVMTFIATENKGFLYNLPPISYLVASFVCFLLNKLLFNIRTTSRDNLEFDEYGNKKGFIYKNLSKEQKTEIDKQRLLDKERLLSDSELKKITHKGEEDPEKSLNKLIGLGNVKEEVRKMEATMEYEKKYGKKKNDVASAHMCFLGNPGTGKTTVARIMTGILYKYKYIKKNQCIETDAAFLKGSTPDDTLRKLKILLQRSKGGVLFIDEAYSLLDGINGNEMVAELVKFMEDNKKDFILILAGYQNEMKKLIDSNPGLYSRINKYLWFKDYDINELKDIFRYTANECGFCVETEALDKFEVKINREKRGKNFGNARTVKNIFQKAKEKHAYNIMTGVLDKGKAYFICEEDIEIESDESFIFNQ